MPDLLRYRDLAGPAGVDTSVVDDGSSARLQQLANTFKAFESTTAGLGGEVAAARGAQEGAAAGAAGQPDLKSTLRAATSKYAAAYNNAATRSYLINAEADLEDTAARIEAEAGTNAEQFALTFDKVQQKVLAAAPGQMRGALGEMFTRRRGAALARIGTAAIAEQNKSDRADLAEGVGRATDRIANLRASDDPADALLAEEEDLKLSLLVDGAVNSGTISRVEGDAALINAQRSVTAQTVVARFRKELDNPYSNPVDFIERLKKANVESEALPPDQEEKLVDALLAELREKNALASAAASAASDARRERWLTGNRDATNSLLAGTLRQSTLQRMVANDEIDPDTARVLANELSDPSKRLHSDPRTLLDFTVNLLERSEEDILSEPSLAPDDKSRLVLKLREDLTGWRGSVPGREAADRIDRSLGLVPGSIMNAMLSNEERTKRERAMTDWYNTVSALPPEEREARSIEMAEMVIERTIRNDARQRLATARDNLASAERELAAAKAAGRLGKVAEQELQDKINLYRDQVTKAEQAAR